MTFISKRIWQTSIDYVCNICPPMPMECIQWQVEPIEEIADTSGRMECGREGIERRRQRMHTSGKLKCIREGMERIRLRMHTSGKMERIREGRLTSGLPLSLRLMILQMIRSPARWKGDWTQLRDIVLLEGWEEAMLTPVADPTCFTSQRHMQ
jgi:hypothetical protein